MRRWEVPGHYRFITFSCYRRLPLLMNDRICELLVERIREVRLKANFSLFAWVIMPEHVHLLVEPGLPEHPLGRALGEIKGPVAEAAIERWRELKAPVLDKLVDSEGRVRFWQPGGGYDRNIFSAEEFDEKRRYIHNNPVRRGLVELFTDWRWSSARWYWGMESCLWMDADPRTGRWDDPELVRAEFHEWERYMESRGRALPLGAEAMRERLGIGRLG
ncbi:MAG: REP-associated tyrosine transposase [Phycisphaerales bacterium]